MSDSNSSIERQARPAPNQRGWLRRTIHRVATPFVTGLFIVSMISGVAVFLQNPAFATVNLMTQAQISDLAPVLKSTPEMVLMSLQRGYSVQSADLNLDDVAASSGKSAREILFSLMSVQ